MNEANHRAMRWLGRRYALALLFTYPFLVGLLALGKLTVPLVSLTWPELFYGPAITIVCCYALVMLASWIAVGRRAP